MRKVINKMVTEEDLIRTVATAYSHGWRQVKLYFMCGLPTETDEDVLADRRPGQGRDRQGARGLRTQRHPVHGLDRRVRTQGAHPLPVGRPTRPRDHRRAAAKLRDVVRADRQFGRPSGSAITTASPGSSRACSRAGTAGSGASSRRCGVTVAASTAGASTSPSTGGWRARRGRWPVRGGPRLVHHPRAPTTRCCRGTTSTPAWTRTGCGVTGRTLSRRPTGGHRGRGLPLDALLMTAGSAPRWAPRSSVGPTG
jgi:hypothetical protein